MPLVGGASVKLPRRKFLHLAAGAVALPAMPRVALALDYPTRPVHWIVGYPAGGGTDISARLMARSLSERLGQPFVVENRAGAASNIAIETVVRARPDGYTLLETDAAAAINATLYDKLNFNFIRDIAVIGIIRTPLVLLVHPSVPAKTIPEFIAYAKANQGKISYASGGVGGPPDPHFHYLVDENPRPLLTYNDLEPQYGHDEAMRRIKEAMDKEQADYQRACIEWQPQYDRATEYAASQIFVALREGRLRASGRLLPSLNVDEAIASLEAQKRYIGDLPLAEIPRSFWSLKGIHFEISAAQNSEAYYCHVLLLTDDLLTVQVRGGR
jgi:hypothetical protein